MSEVVQADRDAAADLYDRISNQSWNSDTDVHSRAGQQMADGKGDGSPFVQAFARHRQASTDDLVEALRQASADFQDHAQHAQRRIDDGDELGARVWRIALEDIVREALQNEALTRGALTKAGAL